MNAKNIRFRILLWYSIALFLATTLIFSSFYVVTGQTLFKQVDRELSIHASKLSGIVSSQGFDLHEAIFRQQLTAEFNDIPGMVVVLLDQQGDVVRSSFSNDSPYMSYQYLFQQAQNSSEPVYLNQYIGHVPMRFISRPVKNENGFLGVVLVAHPIDAIQKSLNILLATLAVILFLFIFPSIIGGRMLASRIMRPISTISDKMEEISSEHLEERVRTPQTGDEIEKLGVAFNRLLDRLQESFQRERQFIGDVAHELKTPVSILNGEIELALSKSRTNEEYKQTLGETLVDVNRLSTMIKNILDLAWLGAEKTHSEESCFSLSAQLVELKEIATKLAARKHIVVKGDIKQGVLVTGMEDKISRAILNVIDNAIKYTPKDGIVEMSLYKDGEHAIVRIKDTGIGISKKELPHIFDRFYRGSRTRRALGSGLGLAIAQGIVKAHKGEIKVSSTIGKGTTISISLPLVDASS